MFTELPKLFDKNFATAFFLPVTLFLTASTWLLKKLDLWSKVAPLFTGQTILDLTLAVFTAWMISILLMIVNREIYRVLEGYGKYNPLRALGSRSRAAYKSKRGRLKKLNDQYYQPQFTQDLADERMNLMIELAQRYPYREDLVLPTAFGNTVRAFETYPNAMYGFEGIDGWARILTVVPKEYRELIDDVKSQVDWWVNLGALSFFFLLEFWICILYKWKLSLPWEYHVLNLLVPIGIFTGLNYFFMWRAVSSAIGWGDFVKSAFDAYRFDLLERLDIDIPRTRAEEKTTWLKYSQAILYRKASSLPELKRTNPHRPTSFTPGQKR
jgi:hypothetical protein